MVKNVRWLYVKLGNDDFSGTGQSTITGALSTLQSGLDDKSPVSHTHTVDTLPVSSNQVNSENYVPTSALLYSMVQRANTVADNVATVNEIINGGGSSDPSDPSVDTTDPNTRYESKDLGVWASLSDVNTFFSTYTHDNNYTGLSLGNYVTIQDGTYNTQWVIAGFDMEHNQTAADGTTYNNGYGICMIPKTQVTTATWNDTAVLDDSAGYMYSTMNTTHLPGIVTKLQIVLGSHLIRRNVLLSNSISQITDGEELSHSNGYEWTTAYATLMSVGQMTGKFASHTNAFDDGEANYKLPVFNYTEFKTGSDFWSRGFEGGIRASYKIWRVDRNGSISSHFITYTCGVRPLIYLR